MWPHSGSQSERVYHIDAQKGHFGEVSGCTRFIVAVGVLVIGFWLLTGRVPHPFFVPFWVMRGMKRHLWDTPRHVAGLAVALLFLLGLFAAGCLIALVKEMIERGVHLQYLAPLGLFLAIFFIRRWRKGKKVRPLPGRR